jgi:hypothetical protein
MGLGLSNFGRRLLTSREKLKDSLNSPLLIWEAPSGKPDEMLLLATQAANTIDRPRSGEPLVFELRKGDAKQNAFAMGITLGRTDNNDVVIEDNSISRFHSYFQKDTKTGLWKVVDAESKNGSWMGPLKLKPNKAEILTDKVKLRFGDIEMQFFEPDSFLRYLEAKMAE